MNFNIKAVDNNTTEFQKERIKCDTSKKDIPLMCSGCLGFSSKARHQQVYPANGKNLIISLVSIGESKKIEHLPEDFKHQLNTLGRRWKLFKDRRFCFNDRSYRALKRKKDKKTDTT